MKRITAPEPGIVVQKSLIFEGLVYISPDFIDELSRHLRADEREKWFGTYFLKTVGRCLPNVVFRFRSLSWDGSKLVWGDPIQAVPGYYYLTAFSRESTFASHTFDLAYHGRFSDIKCKHTGEFKAPKELPLSLGVFRGGFSGGNVLCTTGEYLEGKPEVKIAIVGS